MFEDKPSDRFKSGYAVLVVGLWGFRFLASIGDSSETTKGLLSFAAWSVSTPLIVGAAIYYIVLHAGEEEKKEKIRLYESAIFSNQFYSPKPVEKIATPKPEPIITNEPDPPKTEGKRGAEEFLESSRFHVVKQTRTAKEALEASLDEF